MSDTVRSIFRQRKIEKLYELRFTTKPVNTSSWLLHGSHAYDERTIPYIATNRDNIITDKEIARYYIKIPILEIGEEFFLHDIEKIVKVKNKMRSSDGSITYYVEDELVETDNTKKSYEECKIKIEHWNHEEEKFEALRRELNFCKKEFDDYKKKYKYEHRFF